MAGNGNGPGDGVQQPIISVQSLWKVYGPDPERALLEEHAGKSKEEVLAELGLVVALRDVSLEVRKGESFVVMGLSGSGKSTLVRCLPRLIEPTSGRVLIYGDDVTRFDRRRLVELRRSKLAMVFQHFGLLPHRTVLDNAALGLELQGVPREQRNARAMEVLARVGLAGWDSAYPDELSGGMQQRVGLARALAVETDVLLMDEPFSGLDPLIRREMQDELVTLQEQLKKTIVFITHDLNEALKLGNRIAIMRDGAVVQLGTPEEIVTAPAEEYVQEFVKDVSRSQVLTAQRIMHPPAVEVFEWQGPGAVLHAMDQEDVGHACVVGHGRVLRGMITRRQAVEMRRLGKISLRDAPLSPAITAAPDAPVGDLIGMGAADTAPIVVVDERQRVLGVIPSETLLGSMAQPEPAAAAAGGRPEAPEGQQAGAAPGAK